MSWPLQNAHPLGGKLNGNILISATNGSAMILSLSPSLVLRRENALKRDTKTENQVRLHIRMRLAATNITYGTRMHRVIRRISRVVCFAVVGPEVTCSGPLSCIDIGIDDRQITVQCVQVLRHLTGGQCMSDFATSFAQRVSATKMIWNPPSQIGQRKIRLPVPSIGCSQQREQSLVLINWQQLPVAESPTFRREVEAKDPDFGQKRFRHRCDSSICVQHERRLNDL